MLSLGAAYDRSGEPVLAQSMFGRFGIKKVARTRWAVAVAIHRGWLVVGCHHSKLELP